MATTFYDIKTGQVAQSIGTRLVPGTQRTIEQFNIATGNAVTTVAPNQPKGYAVPVHTFRPESSQQSQTATQLGTSLAVAVGIKSDAGPIQGYAPIAPDIALLNQGTLAQRTAASFASDLYNKYEGLFHANQMKGLDSSFKVVSDNFQSDLQVFRSKYAERDESLLPAGVEQSMEALKTRALQGTPREPAKLFGFLPIKVSGLVQNLATLGAIVGTAYAPSMWAALQGGSGATVTPTVTATPVSNSAILTTSGQTGGFVADLGIRGAQAVNLTAIGASPGGAIGLSPVISSAPLTLGAAGNVVATTPGLYANPTAGRLALPTVSQPTTGVIDWIKEKLSSPVNEAKNYVVQNPVKAGLSAAGTGLTLKQIADSKDPFAALVNTVSSAVGLGPIIKPEPPAGPGPGTVPPSMFGNVNSGGGGGGGGSYGGTTVYEQAGILFPIMGIIAAFGLLLILARR